MVLDPVAAVLSAEINAVPAPLWTPWPVPENWKFTGLAHTGRSVSDGSAVTCWSGPDPFGDPAEMLLISEEAGAGVGSHFAALPVTYPGPEVGRARHMLASRWRIGWCRCGLSTASSQTAPSTPERPPGAGCG